MAGKKQLTPHVFQISPSIDDPGSGHIAFGAKADGLYQKTSGGADKKLATVDDVGSVADNAITYAKQGAEFKGDLTITGNDIDWATGFRVPTITLTANRTFTFSNLEAGKTIVVKMTGSYTSIWPSGVNNPVGTYNGAKVNYLIFTCINSSTVDILLSIQTMP